MVGKQISALQHLALIFLRFAQYFIQFTSYKRVCMERSDSAHLQYRFVANSIASPRVYLSIESFAGSK